MIQDVIGCDHLDQEPNHSNKKQYVDEHRDNDHLLNASQAAKFNSMNLFAYPNHEEGSSCYQFG